MPVLSQGVLFTFMLLLSSVVIPVMCYATGAFPKPFVFAPAIFDCYLFALLAFALRRLRLAWLVWLAAILLLGGEVFSLLCYQSPYSMTVLQLILETNTREATEFLRGHGVLAQLALSVAITFATIVVAWACSGGARGKVTPAKRPSTSGAWERVGAWSWRQGVLLLLILLSASCQGYSYFRLWQAYTADVTTTIAENKYMPLRNSPFVRFLYGHALNVVSTKELGKLVHTVRQSQVDSCSFRSPIILLLIGRFVGFDTTITAMKKTFHNLVSSLPLLAMALASTTVMALVGFSTGYLVTPNGVVFNLFIAQLYLLVMAGYRVWFITNQFAGAENNKDHHDHAGGTIFNQSDLRRLQFTHMNTEAARFDMELLSQLPPADTLAAAPSLLIFHMIGQHEDYRERYPAEYNHFTADSIRNPFTDRDGCQIVAEYDNATLYNDAVVTALLRQYASQDVVALYLSDHGEEVYDWRNSCYRTNSDYMTPQIARYQYEIPMLFYVSDSFKEQHPDLLAEIRAARHKPFLSTMLPFLLFHLAGISQADYQPSLDILSPDYNEHYPRIIREDVDYDQLMQAKAQALPK